MHRLSWEDTVDNVTMALSGIRHYEWVGGFHFYSGFFYSKLKQANQSTFEMCFLNHYLMDGSGGGIQLYLNPPLNKHLNDCQT